MSPRLYLIPLNIQRLRIDKSDIYLLEYNSIEFRKFPPRDGAAEGDARKSGRRSHTST